MNWPWSLGAFGSAPLSASFLGYCSLDLAQRGVTDHYRASILDFTCDQSHDGN
jgi:hypothetical protein